MKRILLRIVAGIGVLLAIVVVSAVVFVFGFRPRVRPAPNVTAPTSAEAIARGEYLANHVALCPACHSDALPFHGHEVADDRRWVGKDLTADVEKAGVKGVGVLSTHNLTSSKEHGIGAFSDGELLRAIRDGIGRDGRPLFPMMPYPEYAEGMSEADALAIIAYLRTLPPKEESPQPSQLGFFGATLARMLVAPAPDRPALDPQSPEHGRRLLTEALCVHCHNGEHASVDAPDFAGGQESSGVITPNITSDPVAGIGTYTEEDIIKVLEGTKKSGEPVREMPTAFYKGMSDTDKRAIARAVKAIPPVSAVPSPR